MLRVNVLAMHRLFKFTLHKMKAQGFGTILNVASSAGLLPGGPYMAGYYASKAYVVSLTRGVAEELREQHSPVYVCALCPGPVDTEFNDPAAVVFDSIQAAKARGVDVVIIDTAGRLHNKANLMNELNKITRVIRRELPEADIETLMVLDATTGQNGLIQAKQFLDTADLTGIVLTKLDGTAKGGIVFAIANDLQLPVKYVGVGEQIDDLLEFKPAEFVEALLS